MKFREAFDRAYETGVGQFCQNGGLIAGAGTDFEHLMAGTDGEGFGHGGDHVGLADGLAGQGGEGGVFVGMAALGFAQKEFAGDVAHGGEDVCVFDAATAKLVEHHKVACEV